MSWSFSHPNTDTLVGFASHSLSSPDERQVAQHLESCTQCRDTVIVLRAVNDDVPHGQPPEEFLNGFSLHAPPGVEQSCRWMM